MNLAANLKFYRKNCGHTQEDMGRALGVDRSTYTYYETGRSSPSLENLVRIIRILGVPSVDALLGVTTEDGTDAAFSSPGSVYSALQNSRISMPNLSNDETDIILYFRQLSPENKEKAKAFLSDLRNESLD